MNVYKGQIVCLTIVLFIALFYFSNQRIATKSSRWFSAILIVAILQLSFEMVTLYTVNHLDSVSPFVNRLVHNIFLVLLLTLFYMIYRYLEIVIEEEVGEQAYRFRYSAVPYVITIPLMLMLPLNYIQTPNGNYSHGPEVYALYGCIIVYIALIVHILFKCSNDIPAKKRKAIIISMLGELILSLYQAIVPTALISSLGITIIILGVYLTVENQDAVLVELLEKEKQRADIANQSKTNFLANMSHEIRTPINAVLGMNEMILRESKERAIKEYAKDVQGAAKSLLSIINDILDITKIEAGKITIIPTEYAFSSMIHDVTNMILFKAKAKELELEVDIDERIPSRMIGDDVRIRQILVNLLNNAVKYTHQGTVTFKASLLPSEEDSCALILFSIKDTGIGIKEEDIQKLCIPFERIEEKRNRNIEGTGLGMSITTQLLAMLDSQLKVASEYGHGSEFSFVLRQEIVDAEPIGRLGEQIATEQEKEEYQIKFEAPKARILVVDDNEMNRKVFCGLLKHTKIQIDEAASGKECLDKVVNVAYDIIFMDHMMPEMDGVETLQAMKAIEEYPCKDTPVVVLTANAIVGAKEQYLRDGFDDFLPKPIDIQKLENMIENLLDDSLVHRVEKSVEELYHTEQVDVSNLPMIDGLDWQYAAAHFNDNEAMLDTVRFFVSAIDYDADELEALYLELAQENGLKNYRIKVHGMKNSASIIGIIPLAGMAKVLEDAARTEDVAVLHNMHSIFLTRWRAYKEHLAEFSVSAKEGKNAAEHKEQIAAIYDKVRTAAEDMDIDALDACLEELEEYQFEGEQQVFFEKVKKAIINFDVEVLQEILKLRT